MDRAEAPRAPRVAVVIPARDEEEALPLVLAELPREQVDHIVVVDNGSRDRTAELARSLGAIVVREPVRGYGQACLAGLACLWGTHPDPASRLEPPLRDEDIVVFLDADHSDFPEDLPRILEPLLSDRADLVIGSRVLGGARMDAMLPQAWLGNRFACFLMRLLFGARATDLGPFRAIRSGALRRLGMRDRGFGWTIEMQLKAHAQRLRVVEVGVRYRPRIGRSKITGTLSGTLGAGTKILGWIALWRLRTAFASATRRSPSSR
jgi:glycosyltransferase involved in cell wall biosynthesis